MKNSYHYRFTCKLRKNGKKIASLKLNMRILHYLLNSSDFISYLISQTEIVKAKFFQLICSRQFFIDKTIVVDTPPNFQSDVKQPFLPVSDQLLFKESYLTTMFEHLYISCVLCKFNTTQ